MTQGTKWICEPNLDEFLKSSHTEFNWATSSNMATMDTPKSIFDVFFKKCQQYHESPAQTLQEIKHVHSTKAKGDLFEFFCQRYLLTIKGYDQVWLLKELSQDLKKQLKLPLGDKDYGIDLVCLKRGAISNQYSAVQCKFKTPRPPIKVTNKKNEIKTIYPSVNWKELSTFNELCNASGPWTERITMTTAPSVRRLGGIKDPKDRSICVQTFKSLTNDQWLLLMRTPVEIPKKLSDDSEIKRSEVSTKIPIKLKLGKTGEESFHLNDSNTVEGVSAKNPTVQLSKEEIRAKRLEYFFGPTKEVCPQHTSQLTPC